MGNSKLRFLSFLDIHSAHEINNPHVQSEVSELDYYLKVFDMQLLAFPFEVESVIFLRCGRGERERDVIESGRR